MSVRDIVQILAPLRWGVAGLLLGAAGVALAHVAAGACVAGPCRAAVAALCAGGLTLGIVGVCKALGNARDARPGE